MLLNADQPVLVSAVLCCLEKSIKWCCVKLSVSPSLYLRTNLVCERFVDALVGHTKRASILNAGCATLGGQVKTRRVSDFHVRFRLFLTRLNRTENSNW